MNKPLFGICVGVITFTPLIVWAQGPQLDAKHSVLLTWPDVEEEYVVTEASSIGGPWTPVLATSFQDRSEHAATVVTGPAAQFFGLARGTQFAEDFSDGKSDAGWTRYGDVDGITRSFINGHYDIRGGKAPALLFAIPEAADQVDFAGSVDILDWSTADIEFGIAARIDWSTGSGYAGGIRFETGGSSYLWIIRFQGHNQQPIVLSIRPWQANLAKDYRLIFKGTGPMMTADLYEAENLKNILLSVTAENSTHVAGQLGLFLFNWGTRPANMSILLDNLLLCGTTP